MSFKREGDDRGLLNNLRRRRIKELLGEDIPEDEAKLLCNGRFACLVCGHNPVFDTVNMLSVHRQGKKHAASKVEFVRKKKELKALILRRQHEQYMKDGTTNIRQAAATSSGGLLSSQPYDPCVKKRKVKPYERRARLDLGSAPAFSQSQSQPQSLSTHAFSATVPQKHSHQLKNIFRPSQTCEGPVTPYVRQHKTHTDSSPVSCRLAHSVQTAPSGDQSSSQTFQDAQCSGSISSTTSPLHSSLHNPAAAAASLRQSSSFCSSSASIAKPTGPQGSRESMHCCAETGGQLSRGLCTAGTAAGIQAKGAADGLPSAPDHADAAGNPGGADAAGSTLPADVMEKKMLAQKYYQISGSGWKKDWDGKWIRDEEAEFDSDEEPPDLP